MRIFGARAKPMPRFAVYVAESGTLPGSKLRLLAKPMTRRERMVSKAGLQLFTRKLQIRSALPDRERQLIGRLPSETMAHSARRPIYGPGLAPKDRLQFITKGIAGRYAITRGGARQLTALYFPGDAIDLQRMLLPGRRSGVYALARCEVESVLSRDFEAILAGSPAIARAVHDDLAVDAAILEEWLVNVGRRDARSRVAHLLCEIVARLTQAGLFDGHSGALPLTQEHLADALGLTPVHVNRVLRGLREEGMATFRDRRLQIHDWKRLQETGQFRSGYLYLGGPGQGTWESNGARSRREVHHPCTGRAGGQALAAQ
jgi:CRP-like cAMP-binding protein